MLNRRSFFKRFGGLIATVAIAQQVIRQVIITRNVIIDGKEWIINPEWEKASYNCRFPS